MQPAISSKKLYRKRYQHCLIRIELFVVYYLPKIASLQNYIHICLTLCRYMYLANLDIQDCRLYIRCTYCRYYTLNYDLHYMAVK